MLARKYHMGAEWLNNIMIVLLYYVCGEFFARLFGESMGPFFIAIPLLTVICSYFARVYIERLPVYIAAHILMYAAVFLIPLSIKYLLTAFIMVTIFTICDLFFWTQGEVRSFIMVPPALSLIFASVFIYSSMKEAIDTGRIAYVCGICFLSLYFLRTYLLNGARFASGMLINKNTPIEEMFRHNSRLVFPLIIGFSAGMFLLQSDALARALSAAVKFLMDCIGRFIVFLLSLLPKGTVDEQTEIMTHISPGLSPAAAAPKWLIALFTAFEKTAAVFIICLAVYYVIKLLIRFIRMYFYRNGYDMTVVDSEDHTEIKERIRHEGSRGIRKLLSGLSESERIRKRYRIAVYRLCRKGYKLRKAQTPAERALEAGSLYDQKGSEGFKELTADYEKARYYGRMNYSDSK